MSSVNYSTVLPVKVLFRHFSFSLKGSKCEHSMENFTLVLVFTYLVLVCVHVQCV